MVEYQKEISNNEQIIKNYNSILNSCSLHKKRIFKYITFIAHLFGFTTSVFLTLILLKQSQNALDALTSLIGGFFIGGLSSGFIILMLEELLKNKTVKITKDLNGKKINIEEEMDKLYTEFNTQENHKFFINQIDESITKFKSYGELSSDTVSKLQILKKEFIIIVNSGSKKDMFDKFLTINNELKNLSREEKALDSFSSLSHNSNYLKKYL